VIVVGEFVGGGILSLEDFGSNFRKNPMPKRPTEKALWRFALLANRESLNAGDWERFYGFISIAARYRVGWDHDEIARRLGEFGFSAKLAQELCEIYWHSRCVLFARGHRYTFGSHKYSDWSRKRGTALT
jgi:hypothetical protein